MSLYKGWIEAFQSAGIKSLSDDTCCKLLAVVYVFGGNSEAFTHNVKLLADVEYAQKRLNIGGSLVPDLELAPILRGYIAELEKKLKEAPYKAGASYVFQKDLDCWAVDLMGERYDIKLI